MNWNFWKRLGVSLLVSMGLLLGVGGLAEVLGVSHMVSAQDSPFSGSTKHVNVDAVSSSSELTYTIVVSNSSDQLLTSVLVTDTLDPRLQYVAGSLEVEPDLAVEPVAFPVVELAAILAKQEVTITFRAVLTTNVDAGAVIPNSALINDGENVFQTNEVDVTVVQENNSPLKGSEKLVSPQIAPPDGAGEIEYTIVLVNDSDQLLTSVLVTDTLDQRLQYVAGSLDVEPDLAVEPVEFPVVELAAILAKQEVTIRFRARLVSAVPDGTVIPNKAQINDGEQVFWTNEVNVTFMEQPMLPHVRIDSPLNGGIVTDPPSTTYQIRGVAWITPSTFPADPVLLPINYEPGNPYYFVEWEPVDRAEAYVLEESEVPNFEALEETYVVFSPTTKQPVEDLAVGTYYYRVRADNARGLSSRWSNVESVTVTQPSVSSDIVAPNVIDRIDDINTIYLPDVVEVKVGDGDWQSASLTETAGYWEWTYDWFLPMQDNVTYTIQARACDDARNCGETDAVTVTLFNATSQLTISKRVSPSVVSVGDHLYYTLDITNSGVVPVYDLVITDAVPLYTQYITGGQLMAGNIVSWPVGQLDAGQSVSVSFEVRPTLGMVTVINRKYGAYSERGSASGKISVSIYVDSARFYLPLTMKRWPPYPSAPTVNPIENSDNDGNYPVTWSYNYPHPSSVKPNYYELFESVDLVTGVVPDDCPPGNYMSCNITGREPGTYYYFVRGRNSYGLYSPLSNVESVTVDPFLYVPTLNAIDNADGDTSYTISWVHPAGEPYPPTSYEVQQDTSVAFSNPVAPCQPGANTSCAIEVADLGTYYYRVRGINDYGVSAWSNTQAAVVTVPPRYFDDFVDYSGWRIRRSDDHKRDPNDFIVSYMHESMYTLLNGRYDFAVVSPMVAPPDLPYTIRASVRVVDETIDGDEYYPKDGETFGIVFGANGGEPCSADRETPQGEGCFSHYYRLLVVWAAENSDAFKWSLKRIDYHDPAEGGKGDGHTLIDYRWTTGSADTNGWNEWKIEVSEEAIKVYVNGHFEAEARDTTYLHEPYFGTFMASPQYGGVGFRWDWFEVKHE